MLLYYVRENQPPPAYHSLYLSIFLSLKLKFLSQISRLLWEPKSSNFVYTLRVAKYSVGKKNQDAEINFCLLFPFFFFSISHSNVIHKEICVKDFSGISAPRILRFGANIGYVLLHCVRENQSPDAYRFLYLSIFLSLQSDFLLQISLLLWEPESSNFLYILRVAKYIVGQKTKMMRLIYTIFLHFSLFFISHSRVIHREICVKDFSGTTGPRILKFVTNVEYDLLCCVREIQHAAAYHSPYLPIFLSLQAKFLLQIS